MFGVKLLGLALSFMVGVTPISFVLNENEFPQQRNLELRYDSHYTVQDLGISSTTSYNSSTIQTQTQKHDYHIDFQTTIVCSEACAFTNAEHGYNISSNVLVVNQSHDEWGKETSQMFQYLNSGWQTYGYKDKLYTFSTNTDQTFIQVDIDSPWGVTYVNVHFYAEPEGTVLKELQMSFDDWKELDIEHKTHELQYFIYQMAHNGTPLSQSVQTQYESLISSGDVEGAYQVINNYYYGEQQTTNEKTESTISDFDNHNSSLDTLTTQEQNFAGQIESDFTSQIGQISTQNITQSSDFQNSAIWVTDKFNRFTQNNAFGSLLGFSLLIGFAMAIIGRVLK